VENNGFHKGKKRLPLYDYTTLIYYKQFLYFKKWFSYKLSLGMLIIKMSVNMIEMNYPVYFVGIHKVNNLNCFFIIIYFK